MTTVTLEDAQARLAEIVTRLTPGKGVVITRNGKPVARLEAQPEADDATRIDTPHSETQARLWVALAALAPGEALISGEGGVPTAVPVAQVPEGTPAIRLGKGGMIEHVDEDHLADFAGYMP